MFIAVLVEIDLVVFSPALYKHTYRYNFWEKLFLRSRDPKTDIPNNTQTNFYDPYKFAYRLLVKHMRESITIV